MKKRTAVLLTLGVILAFVSPLFPSALDLTVAYNARANAMASAGMAVAEGAMSIGLNPAGLGRINKFQFEATLNNMLVARTAPAQRDGKGIESDSYLPLFYIGGTYRINDLITVGLNVYTPGGGGAIYDDINFHHPLLAPKEMGGQLVFIEGGPAVALNLPANLTLGIAYRIDYVKQTFNMYLPFASDYLPSGYTYNKLDISGVGYQGIRVGLQWDPTEKLHFGVSFRNKIEVDLDGTTEAWGDFLTPTGATAYQMATKDPMDTKMKMKSCDKLIAGVTYDIIKDKWMASLDVMQTFYSQYDSIIITNEGETAMGPLKTETPLRYVYDNCTGVAVGTEYWMKPNLPVRAGVHYSTAFYNEKYFSPISGIAPAPVLTIGLGTGYRLSECAVVDVSYNFVTSKGTIEASPPYPDAWPGDYELSANYIAVNFIYKLK
ncbi:outer membrane protein transport protein [candidate division KSB1 bacterium]|nr:outer membrane protein transport protein [candidate division KSB1 bacterium]